MGKAPYVYGGAGPSGFDCSGFTMYIYGQFGIRLPHGATDQMRYGAAVDRSQLQPGDLIFFHDDYYSSSTASHCGIYVGNDQFVHASTYGSGGVLLTAPFFVLLSLVGVMVGEIVQKHLPQMTACRRKKPLKKPRVKSPLYRVFTSQIRQKAVSEMAQLFAAFFGRSGTFRSVRKP